MTCGAGRPHMVAAPVGTGGGLHLTGNDYRELEQIIWIRKGSGRRIRRQRR